jgi:hypothetical protein
MIDLAAVAGVLALLVVVVLYGDGPEMLGGQIMMFLVIFGLARSVITLGPVSDFDMLGLIADGLAFVGFLWIALFAWRLWPIWIASLQLLAILAHVGPLMELPIAPLAYAIMRSAPTTIALVTLLGATLLHQRKRRLGVNMLPWRTWSGHLNQISPKRWQTNFFRHLGR